MEARDDRRRLRGSVAAEILGGMRAANLGLKFLLEAAAIALAAAGSAVLAAVLAVAVVVNAVLMTLWDQWEA
jgi:hypothetical protein